MFKVNEKKVEFISEFSKGFNSALESYSRVAKILLPAANLVVTVSKVVIKITDNKSLRDQWNESGIKLGESFYDELEKIKNVGEEVLSESVDELTMTRINNDVESFKKAVHNFKSDIAA